MTCPAPTRFSTRSSTSSVRRTCSSTRSCARATRPTGPDASTATRVRVVRPADADDVAAVLAACSAAGAPSSRRAATPGWSAAACPRGGEVVLSLLRLRDAASTATRARRSSARASCSRTCSRPRAREGWDLGVDLSSRGSCTIGGMVATNAGGEHVLRYGAMVDQVIGVEAALADGSRRRARPRAAQGQHRLPLGRPARRQRGHARASSPACTCAWSRSSRPRRRAARRSTTSARAVAVCARLRRDLDSLVALEVCFADGIELVRRAPRAPRPVHAGRAGRPARGVRAARRRHGRARRAARRDRRRRAGGARLRGRDATNAPRARFWSYREGHAEAINAAGIPHKLDVTLPFDRARRVRARGPCPRRGRRAGRSG